MLLVSYWAGTPPPDCPLLRKALAPASMRARMVAWPITTAPPAGRSGGGEGWAGESKAMLDLGGGLASGYQAGEGLAGIFDHSL